MKERPILFSGPMVRAILDGRKTQTRRVVKPQPLDVTNEGVPYVHISHDVVDLDARRIKTITHTPEGHPYVKTLSCPYGKPGDRLWVRESFRELGSFQKTDNKLPWRLNPDMCVYMADGQHDGPWRPSIHMPRGASRITLEITGVRVERLQDISEEDAYAEGRTLNRDAALDAYFPHTWDLINGKKHPWASNPWVWVVEFKQI